jgi:hypothetical protein
MLLFPALLADKIDPFERRSIAAFCRLRKFAKVTERKGTSVGDYSICIGITMWKKSSSAQDAGYSLHRFSELNRQAIASQNLQGLSM